MRRHLPLVSAIAFVAVSAGLPLGFWPALTLVTAGTLAALAAVATGRGGAALEPVRALPRDVPPAGGGAPRGEARGTGSLEAGREPVTVAGGAGAADASRGAARWLLALALVAFCVWHVLHAPGIYVRPPQPAAFRLLAALSVAVASTYLLPSPRWAARPRFLLLVALFLAMGLVVVRASPRPFIDVWWYQQWAGELAWQGYNPYSFDYPNIYPDGRLFGPGVLRDGRISAYPYPPLTFLLGAPVVRALHDVRYLLLALMAAAAVIAGRWAEEDASEIAALALLFQPLSFFVLEQGWTEPFVAAAFAVTVLAVLAAPGRRRGWLAAGLAGGLLVATKQYVPAIALPLALALPRPGRLRALAVAAGVAAATMLPFVVADPGEFWHDVVVLQTLQPFRPDSLSWLVPVARALGRPVTAAWGFAALGFVLAVGLRPGLDAAQAARISAAAMLAFVLFNKQAFANYYWLCTALLAFACALALREGRAGPTVAAPGSPRSARPTGGTPPHPAR